MHKIEKVLGIGFLVFLLFIAPVAADTLVVHTNDVHGRFLDNTGYDGLSAFIQECKANGDEVILVDAGDAFQGLSQANYFQGLSSVDLMNQLGYQVMVPGNNDYMWGVDNIRKLSETADFSIVSSNIVFQETNKPVFEEYKIIEAGGKKYGFFGITLTNTSNEEYSAFLNEEMYQAAQNTADTLKKLGCDYVICLSHLGTNDADEPNRSIDLAQHLTGVDIIIDGHSHTEIPGGRMVNNILITSTGSYLENIGVVRIADSGITAYLINDYEKKDPVITKAANEYIAIVDEAYGEKIGVTNVLLNGERNPGVRSMETNIGDFVTDALLQEAKNKGINADAALVSGAGLRTSLPVGDITIQDIMNISPYELEMYQIQVPGTVLLDILEYYTSAAPGESPGFQQVSGIEFIIDTSKEYVSGENNRVTIKSVGGKPFDKNAVYTIISGINIFTDTDGKLCYDVSYESLNTTLNTMVIDYLKNTKKGVIGTEYAEPQGRISIGEGLGSSTATTSPSSVFGILAGLGAAAVFLKVRRH